MSTAGSPHIALEPAGRRQWLAEAVERGGGQLVTPGEADALVWAEVGEAASLASLLTAEPGIRWVQLPWAGVEPYVEVIRTFPSLQWTCGKGVYAEPVAEMALTLLLAGLRGFGRYARATTWTGPIGRNLLGARVVIVGAGGITESLLGLLQPFGCSTTVVRRREQPMTGAGEVVTFDRLDEVLPGADALVVAAALTPETEGLLDARRMALLPAHAWIVNVARGRHIVTDHLVAALVEGSIGGAALDVTDPEPLPDGHPLWTLPNVLITPHVANTPEMAVPLLSSRVEQNVRRWIAGEALLGVVDPAAGY